MDKTQIAQIASQMSTREDLLAEFDPRLWVTMVENVTIMNDGKMLFRFYDGTEIYG